MAPPTFVSVSGSALWPAMDAAGAAGVAVAVPLAAPSGALATTARTWKSYDVPFASPLTVAAVVAAVAPGTAVHEPHVPEPEVL